MILSVFSLLLFDHSVFAKTNSADQNMSEYLVSMIDNEKKPVLMDEFELKKASVKDIEEYIID